MLSGPQCAALVGVRPSTWRSWAHRGHVTPDGFDERGHPLYFPATARTAEREVTRKGLQVTRGQVNPRQLRQRAA